MNPLTSAVLLVLVAWRVAPSAVLLPSLGARALPAVLRLAVILTLAVGLLPAVTSMHVVLEARWLLVASVREVTIGTALALVIATPFIALEHAGQLLDGARSAGGAATPSLAWGTQTTPLAGMLQATGVVVFLAAGGHRGVLRALAASLDFAPPGAWESTQGLVELSARWTAESLAAALTLGSAAWLAMVASELVLAFAVRLSPVLARSGLELPVRVLAPLAALAASAGLWTDATRSLCARVLEAATHLRGV